MGLRDIAASDFQTLANDTDTGWGWPATVTDSNGTTAVLNGFSNDISELIDPQTGLLVSGRNASIALVYRDLVAAGLGMPVAVIDRSIRPWTVSITHVDGQTFVFKIVEVKPDQTIGPVVCKLEEYKIG